MEIKLYAAICDDEQHIHDIVQNMIDVYAAENGICCKLYHIFSTQCFAVESPSFYRTSITFNSESNSLISIDFTS